MPKMDFNKEIDLIQAKLTNISNNLSVIRIKVRKKDRAGELSIEALKLWDKISQTQTSILQYTATIFGRTLDEVDIRHLHKLTDLNIERLVTLQGMLDD